MPRVTVYTRSLHSDKNFLANLAIADQFARVLSANILVSFCIQSNPPWFLLYGGCVSLSNCG